MFKTTTLLVSMVLCLGVVGTTTTEAQAPVAQAQQGVQSSLVPCPRLDRWGKPFDDQVHGRNAPRSDWKWIADPKCQGGGYSQQQ